MRVGARGAEDAVAEQFPRLPNIPARTVAGLQLESGEIAEWRAIRGMAAPSGAASGLLNQAVMGISKAAVRTQAAEADRQVTYWHRDLPPIDAIILGEHTVEAVSKRVTGTFAHRDRLWNECYDDLMTRTESRLGQEVERLGGHYAHVLQESIDSRHDDATGESWLHGRFTYTLLG